MSFKENPAEYQQLSLTDSFQSLTEREQRVLNKSWARTFADDIFPYIDEKPYKVLYSDLPGKPNTPVNICLGAMIIKEMFGASDDDMVDNLMFDVRYQLALHTTSFVEQPLSDKSLTRLRLRVYEYEQKTGIDLIHGTMIGLADKIAELMDITPEIKRMDSMMIEANIKRLSRIELLYTCIAKLCIYLARKAKVSLPESLVHYTEPDDYNKVIYHSKSDEAGEKLLTLLNDADTLFALCGDTYKDIDAYQLFKRCMSEQTVVDEESRRLKTKEDGEMDSGMMQNPSDPDATFRTKAGKDHRGYVANLTETVGENGTVVTDYQFEKNTYSDSQFLKDYIDRQDENSENSVVITDGAYSGTDNKSTAAEKGIELITTDLTGKDPDPIVTEFEINRETMKVEKCPMGYEPTKSKYNPKLETIHATFQSEQCRNCPHRDRCKATVHTRVSNVKVSVKSIERAESVKYRGTEEFKNYARLRNGVETVPAIMRNVYHVDRMPRRLHRGRLFFGCKVGALNSMKLFNYRRGRGHYAHNPILKKETA